MNNNKKKASIWDMDILYENGLNKRDQYNGDIENTIYLGKENIDEKEQYVIETILQDSIREFLKIDYQGRKIVDPQRLLNLMYQDYIYRTKVVKGS
jgi:hypothetical protein